MPDWIVLRRILLAIVVLIAPAAHGQDVKVGQRAPDFTLSILDGDSAHLAQFRGHPVVLKFWASWCPTCRTEMPELAAAQAAHGDVGLEVLASNGEETPDKMRKYLARLAIGAGLIVLVDPKAHVSQRYRVLVLPTTVFIDSAGVVQVIHPGAISPTEFADGIRAILPIHNQE